MWVPDEFNFTTKASPDRKSTRLNSSHLGISYAGFWLKKKIGRTPTSVGEGGRCAFGRYECLARCGAVCALASRVLSWGDIRKRRGVLWSFFFLRKPAPPTSTLFPHPTPFPS